MGKKKKWGTIGGIAGGLLGTVAAAPVGYAIGHRKDKGESKKKSSASAVAASSGAASDEDALGGDTGTTVADVYDDGALSSAGDRKRRKESSLSGTGPTTFGYGDTVGA